MKVEYIASGSADCPLIRVFDLERNELARLHWLVDMLSNGLYSAIELKTIDFVTFVGEWDLIFDVGNSNRGIVEDSRGHFRCILTMGSWGDVAGLMEPFLEDGTGERYQWLDRTSDVSLLLSPGGRW